MPLPARIQKSPYQHTRKVREGMSKEHLRWIKTLPCCVCTNPANDSHHLKKGIDNMPKGMGRKHADRWAVPVCRHHHDQAEAGDDEAYFRFVGIDARALANALWKVSGDTDAAHRLLYNARARR